jgi:CheY-like chemotaxis protein
MRTVLAVDDDTQNLELVKALVQTMGFDVVTALNAEQALELLERVSFALILLDLRLMSGGMDGWKFAECVRQTPQTAQTPIIAMSVAINTEDIQRAKAVGCNNFIAKPFHLSTLRKYILEAINGTG